MNCSKCGPGIIDIDEPEYSLVGNDVKALFPSIKSANTGKIIREAVENTTVEFEGFDHQKALAYVAMNTDLTSGRSELEHLLPTRKSGRSTKLKIGAIDKDWNPEDKFNFKNVEITRQEMKKLIACVVEIAVRALFENHAYRFGNTLYHQLEGGSIGDRWTGAAAEIVMQNWASNYQKILDDSGVSTLLLAGYVDDGRQYSTSLPMGSRFNPDTRKFQVRQEDLEEDTRKRNNGESTNQRMGRVCLTAMNSINNDLEFTIETPEDFPEEKLPTLDFKLWQEPDQTLNHCYYQKEIKTPYVIMARSGMATQQKLQILANELTRRLSNINKINSIKSQYTRTINNFTQELKNSEYIFKTAREIVISGLRGLRKREKLREIKNQNFYREAKTTARQRAHKKLVNKEIWYKNINKDSTAPTDGPEMPRSLPEAGLRSLKSGKRNKKEQESKIKSVMFVPFTPGSQLAKQLRENEEKLEKLTNTRIKIVERTGTKIQDLLTRSNPWKGHDCERQNCLLCYTKLRTEQNTSQDCHQRNVVYQTRCLDCENKEQEKIENMEIPDQEKRELKNKIKLFLYIGETSRSSYERGWEHLNDLTSLSNKSHMLKHILTEHQEENIKDVKFGIKILRTCRTSFERQIFESVAIQEARKHHNILNSRAEYNRCSLPRLTTTLGEEHFKKYNSELEQEARTEAEMDKKIRELRKLRNKERLVPAREQNAGTKRRKLNNKDYVTIQENWGPPDKTIAAKTPREQEGTPSKPSKRTRTKTAQETITLTNLRTVEDKVIEVAEQDKNLEWEEPRDWDKVLREHRERIMAEEQERNERLERQRKKEQSWELYRLCKEHLENNSTFWKRRKEKQVEENKRQERLEKARQRTKEYMTKLENKKWEAKIQEGLERVPKREIENDTKNTLKQEKLELKQAKENLWKLRGKENKLRETQEVINIRKLDKKTEQVIRLLEKEKNRLLSREQNIRTSIKNFENKTRKQDLLAEVWTTYRWITEYLITTTEEWENKKKLRTAEEQTRIQNWENKTRKQKINSLKETQEQQREQELIENTEMVTSIINDMLSKIASVEAQNDIGRTTYRLEPAKFKPVTEVDNKKQQNITQFLTTRKEPAIKSTTTNTNNITKPKITTGKTTKRNKQPDHKTTEKNRGYWVQLSALKKQQDEEHKKRKENNTNSENNTHSSPDTDLAECGNVTPDLMTETFSKHSASSRDVTKVLEISSPSNLEFNPDNFRKGKSKEITGNDPT